MAGGCKRLKDRESVRKGGGGGIGLRFLELTKLLLKKREDTYSITVLKKPVGIVARIF